MFTINQKRRVWINRVPVPTDEERLDIKLFKEKCQVQETRAGAKREEFVHSFEKKTKIRRRRKLENPQLLPLFSSGAPSLRFAFVGEFRNLCEE
jgi:hypothetical protein